jgi:hypothetical protein
MCWQRSVSNSEATKGEECPRKASGTKLSVATLMMPTSSPLPNTRKRYRAKKNARSGLERARSIFDDVATVSAYLQRLGTPVIKDLNAFLNAGVDPISVQTVLRQ